MKECPSCHTTIQTSLLMCPHCGYSFDSEPDLPEERQVKKTMMGIPSIDLTPSGQPDVPAEDESVRKTMFGFPVNEVVSEVFDEGTDAYEESATQIVDADQFMLNESLNPGTLEAPRFVERSSPIRSTIAGGMPSLAQLQAAQEPSEVSEGEDEDDGANTMVGSASMFQFDGAVDEVQAPPPEDSPKLHNRPRKHETLMGMSLDDLAPESAKHTLFSIPAHDDMGEGLSEFSEDESDVEEDIPTQAISGAIFAQEPVQDATREQNRQRLLDKLRANNKSSEEERPARNTMFGIPAVSVDISSSDENEEDAHTPSLTPHTGVLKIAKKGAGMFTEPSAAAIEKSSSGVLGSSSYMLNKDSTATEEPAVVKKPLPSLSLSASLRDKLSAATATPSTSAPQVPVEPPPEEEDKTQVVTGELLRQALGDSREDSPQDPPHLFDVSDVGLVQESAPTVQGDSLIVEDDMTREQNISDLHAQLRQSSEQAAVPRKHFNDDATRQHDLASIREQLGDDLFSLTPSEASEDLNNDATSVAPSLDEVVPPTSNTGPLFATNRPQDVHELETVSNAPLLKFDEEPGPDDFPVEALPELDVSPLDPYSAPQQPFIPVTPMAIEEPAGAVDLPMIDAVPLPMEPAYKTVTTTSTPTPPHGTQLPSQVPAQPLPVKESDVGRTFQVLFGLLGVVCFLCATVLPLAGIAMPEGQVLSPVVYAPLGLALFALLGALFPVNKVRQGLLILTTLLGIGLFAVGLLLVMPIILSILSLVGALFALTAILFPIFARSM